MNRCDWCLSDPLYISYHDNEWGKPVYNDDLLFEMFILEGFQAGLNWFTILKKRDNFRIAFDNFNANRIANYNQQKIDKLMINKGIVRNKLKINATISNAKAFLKIVDEFGSFNNYIWQFVNHKPILNQWITLDQVPTSTCESDIMSKDLKKRGFKFCGSTICYAYMQATGMVNDHLVSCNFYN